MTSERIVGASVPRKEGRDKVTGQARYVDDMTLPDMLYGATVRTQFPRGRIRTITFGPGIAWNEFVIAVTFLQNDSNITAIVKFYNLTGQYSTDWGEMLAAAVTIVLPVVLVFVFLQRRFIDGMTAGAVKS